MDKKVIDFIKGLMQPALTAVAIVIFAILSLNGTFPGGDVFQVVVGIIIFWFGYTGLKNFNFNKDDSKKASSQAVTSATTGEAGDLSALNEVRDYGMPAKPAKEAISFDKDAFLTEAKATLNQDYGDSPPAYALYARANQLAMDVKWRQNNTLAEYNKDMTMLDLAKARFNEIMNETLGGFPLGEKEPLTYVQDHIEEIKPKCKTCKDTSTLMTVPQVMLTLGDAPYAAYNELKYWADQVYADATALDEHGNQVW